MKLPNVTSVGSAILVGISLVTSVFAQVNIDFVPIGNAGNAGDPGVGGPYGAVTYEYQIARNEVTIDQYAAFLNAVASADPYGLYNPSMDSTDAIDGIIRSGLVSGNYSYQAKVGSGFKPITYVSWFDAARFTNWVQNGQQTGVLGAASTEFGAYTLNGATSGVSVSKNPDAVVWIPSEDEWYKAAYYDPNRGGPDVGGYWPQATQSIVLAGNDLGVANSANFLDGSGFAGPANARLTNVGAYGEDSQSAYGTNDQAGNVWEWTDTVSDQNRKIRGGSWFNTADGVSTLGVNAVTLPTQEDPYIGFRLAAVPEPSSLVLAILAGSVVFIRRNR